MKRSIWLMMLGFLLFLGAAFVTLRAAERAAGQTTQRTAAPASHPPPSAPEESATIADDPTVAPDPAESADDNVSFPTDI
jgi:hypothetical protein